MALLRNSAPLADGVGFYGVLDLEMPVLDVVRDNVSGVTFYVLDQFPLSFLTIAAV